MARKVSGKIIVEARMEAQTPISVGGLGAGDAVDLELAKNGRDKYFIPGTGLMGALRARFSACPELESLADTMFGFQNEKNNTGHASYLIVDDAELTVPAGLDREIRDGIGMNPRTGTTEDGMKYTRAVLPRGTSFTLLLELDLPKSSEDHSTDEPAIDADNFVKAIKWLLDGILQDGLYLGAAKTRGLGYVRAEEIHAVWYKFPNDMNVWLDNTKPLEDYKKVISSDEVTYPWSHQREILKTTIQWQPLSPVMVKSGAEGEIADMLPLVSGYTSGEVTPVIPGSSIKGILRSRAAKILRSVTKADLPEADKEPDHILYELFGSTNSAGRLTVHDVYQSGNKIDFAAWNNEDENIMDSTTDHHDHVAIDRFTGGASDSALFNMRTPKRENKWDDITIHINFSRPRTETDTNKEPEELSSSSKQQMIALLLLVLRDMEAGWVPLGFGSTRGLGEYKIQDITLEGLYKGSLKEVMRDADLQSAWDTFIKDNEV